MTLASTLSTIGTGLTDYSSPFTWEDQNAPGLLPIGVVAAVPELLDDLARFAAQAQTVPMDFVLLHASGAPLVWKLAGDVHKAEAPLPAILRREPLSQGRLLTTVRGFVAREFRSHVELFGPTFRTQNLDAALRCSEDALSELNARLLKHLAEHSADIDRLSWRDLEEVVGEVFRRQGYRVVMGPGTSDEGVDLRLFRVEGTAELPFLVQVKKYADSNPVTLQPVQALYGAIAAEGAAGGFLVTSGRFLPGAKSWADRVAHRLTLAGRSEFEKWLRDAARRAP